MPIQPLSHSIYGLQLHTLCIPCATTAARYRATSRLAALHFTCVPTRTCRSHYMISHRYGEARFPHYSLSLSLPLCSSPLLFCCSLALSIHPSFTLFFVSFFLSLSLSLSVCFGSSSIFLSLSLSPLHTLAGSLSLLHARLLSHVPVFHQRQPINKTPSSKNAVHFPRRRLAATLAP